MLHVAGIISKKMMIDWGYEHAQEWKAQVDTDVSSVYLLTILTNTFN